MKNFVLVDSDPELALNLLHETRARRVQAVLRFADALKRSGFAGPAQQVHDQNLARPELLADPALWQWMRLTVKAAQQSETEAVKSLVDDFGPLAEVIASREETGPIRIVTDTDYLRLPVEDHFEFPDRFSTNQHGAFSEALRLAGELVPSMLQRFATDVVPVLTTADTQHSSTSTDAPGVTHMSMDHPPCQLVAALAHEEAHSLLNSAEVVGMALPAGIGTIAVPWKPLRRSLPAVIHGLAAFSRASAVYQRSLRRGCCMMCEDRFKIESQWVLETSELVERNELGPIDDELREWLVLNREQMYSAKAAARKVRGGEIAANLPFPWRMTDFDRSLAARAFHNLQLAEWLRDETDFYKQDVVDLLTWSDSHVVRELSRYASLVVRPAAEQLAGRGLELATLKAHRYRTGDYVNTHNDAADRELIARSVVGLTPGDSSDTGGLIELVNSDGFAMVATRPPFATVLTFLVSPESMHRVTPIKTISDRLTLVASFRSAS